MKKNCEEGVKGFDLKRFENLFEKDLKKKRKINPNPNPFPIRPKATLSPFPSSRGPASFPTHQSPSAHLPSPSLPTDDGWSPPVRPSFNLQPPQSSSPSSLAAPARRLPGTVSPSPRLLTVPRVAHQCASTATPPLPLLQRPPHRAPPFMAGRHRPFPSPP
jgi:hypothetical protein